MATGDSSDGWRFWAVVVSFLSSTILFWDRIRKPRRACCCFFFFFSGGADLCPEPLSPTTCTNSDGQQQRWAAILGGSAASNEVGNCCSLVGSSVNVFC
ncbi:hypothetical protein MRB53_015410 [Persea americana]|uniref:Uncharacterized protein n=1 Tax=Persea americana TaxID=3435 RepID=A0ACC2KDI3_PERAE|nr:hypothetical protein MRB53_015410 [Persea americana]